MNFDYHRCINTSSFVLLQEDKEREERELAARTCS
jgi:hypothetical protein